MKIGDFCKCTECVIRNTPAYNNSCIVILLKEGNHSLWKVYVIKSEVMFNFRGVCSTDESYLKELTVQELLEL